MESPHGAWFASCVCSAHKAPGDCCSLLDKANTAPNEGQSSVLCLPCPLEMMVVTVMAATELVLCAAVRKKKQCLSLPATQDKKKLPKGSEWPENQHLPLLLIFN